jgi:hypothetical protein
MSRTTFFEAREDGAGWLLDSTTTCASIIKSDIIEAWRRRKKKNHRKEAWKRRKKRQQLKLDWLKPAPPAKVGLKTGYSRTARVSYILALKPPMLSFSLVIKLPLARGSLYIWVTFSLPRIEMN